MYAGPLNGNRRTPSGSPGPTAGICGRAAWMTVPHRKGVAAWSKQMVGGMGGGSLRTRIVAHCDRPRGRCVDTLTAGRPVGCHRNLPVVGMRRVIKRVLHAGREQHGGCHSHHIYILSCLHIVFLPLLEKFPHQCYTGVDGATPIFCLVAAAYAHTIDDFIFLEIGIQVAQAEVEIKRQCLVQP